MASKLWRWCRVQPMSRRVVLESSFAGEILRKSRTFPTNITPIVREEVWNGWYGDKKSNDDSKWQKTKFGNYFKFVALSAAFIQNGDNDVEDWVDEVEDPLEVPVGIGVQGIGVLNHLHNVIAGLAPPINANEHDENAEANEIPLPLPPNEDEQPNAEDQLQQIAAAAVQLPPAQLAELLADAMALLALHGPQPAEDDDNHSVGDLDVAELDDLVADEHEGAAVNGDEGHNEGLLVAAQPAQHEWPFSFEMDFAPSRGNVALVPLPGLPLGLCHRFRKVNNVDSMRDGHNIVRCRNCRYQRDQAIARGDPIIGSVNSWTYDPVNVAQNQYIFLENPFLRHNIHCLQNPETVGNHAAQWLIGGGLEQFKIHPFGTAFSSWNRTFQAAPRLITERFPTAQIDDWVVAINPWHTCKSPWYYARAAVYQPFDWFNIAPCYRLTNMGQSPTAMEGELFVRAVDPDNKLLVMCSPSGARALYNSRVWSIDGTFKCIKRIDGVCQLFVFIGLHIESNEYRPGAYALMPHQTVESYQEVYNIVKQCIREEVGVPEGRELENVNYIISDWEKPISIACTNSFPGVTKKYCCFHMGQSIIRAVRRHHLLEAYRDGDDLVRKYVHALLGTMMIPQLYMNRWANTLRHHPWHPNEGIRHSLADLADYMWAEYLSSPQKLARLDAFSTPLNNPRTSNPSEGFNNMCYRSMRLTNATESVLMSGLVQIDFQSFVREKHLNAGKPAKAKRTKYALLDQRIQDAKEQILPVLAALDGDALDERLHRWARYCARMLGGAVHKRLIGGVQVQVHQIPGVLDDNGDVIDVGNDMHNDNFLDNIIDANDFPDHELNGENPPQPAPHEHPHAAVPHVFVVDDGLLEAIVVPDDDDEMMFGDGGMFFENWGDD